MQFLFPLSTEGSDFFPIPGSDHCDHEQERANKNYMSILEMLTFLKQKGKIYISSLKQTYTLLSLILSLIF